MFAGSIHLDTAAMGHSYLDWLHESIDPMVLAHSIHVTVDLHCSIVVALDPVVSVETTCWE